MEIGRVEVVRVEIRSLKKHGGLVVCREGSGKQIVSSSETVEWKDGSGKCCC